MIAFRKKRKDFPLIQNTETDTIQRQTLPIQTRATEFRFAL
jgi:hypothetical protein